MLTGYEPLQGSRNQFKTHWKLFLNDKLTLKQLTLITFAWVIQHEDLYERKPLPTEPARYYGASEAAYAKVMKAWHLGCSGREMENKSNVICLKKAKKFFLSNENEYDEGVRLFEKYAEPEVVPF